MRFVVTLIAAIAIVFGAEAKPKYHTTKRGTIVEIENEGGRTIGYSTLSGVTILEVDGFAFKDLNRNGRLDRYEDWRLPSEERAEDLAQQLPIDAIAGLMVHSSYQRIPSRGTYNGLPYKSANVDVATLDDEQYRLVMRERVRHLLVTKVCSAYDAARWSNNLQALCESEEFGIPANNSTNPRTSASGRTSVWGTTLSLAATFDEGLVERYGEVASEELRAMGITTLLGPQVEIATEPRWMRVHETFGESSRLSVDLARAYIRGFQSSDKGCAIEGAWGEKSVVAMAKHWPGSGTGEAGRDAHYAYGKYSVYPGRNFAEHLLPFTEGAMRLGGGTEATAAIMVSYNVLLGQTPTGEAVGAGYSKYIVEELLRQHYRYEGVTCSDWRVPNLHYAVDDNKGKPWGVESLSLAERYLRMVMAGMDQVGGITTKQYLEEAYHLGVKQYGEAVMRRRYEASARRLLLNMFRLGLFDNPYLDAEQSRAIANGEAFAKEGFKAQVRSIVMLKNKGSVLPLPTRCKVYIPEGVEIDREAVEEHFEIVEREGDAECALLFIKSPRGGKGYSREDVARGGNGYLPISLQYGEYRADAAREVSLSGGDPLEHFTNRSYRGKSVRAKNYLDAERVQEARKVMGKRPVIVVVTAKNPMVFAEVEPYADAILMGFGVDARASLAIASGKAEPEGLLPLQMPKDMRTVELQAEDMPFDMECYKDSEGNLYDFAYGLNWRGVIKDWRVKKYSKH